MSLTNSILKDFLATLREVIGSRITGKIEIPSL
jgi:hypothetical protein